MVAVERYIKHRMLKQKDIVEGTLKFNNFGSGHVELRDLDRRIYVHKKRAGKAFHMDKVKARILRGKKGLEAEVIEVTERFKDEFVGMVRISDGHAFFYQDSNKGFRDFYIPLNKLNGAKEGQKVIAKLVSWETEKSPRGEIIRILGNAGDNETEIHSILHEYGLPYKFDEEIEIEAGLIPTEITDEEVAKRKDMRDVLTFTIDPETAKDFDDALSVEWEGDNMVVGVHIADVSHYVIPDTDLDKEAFSRGTSVYLVDRVVPMLPEKLSNGVCSLRPHEDKLCFSAVFKINPKGEIVDEWFGKTVIHSDMRFTYEEAQNIIETGNIAGIPFLATSTFVSRGYPFTLAIKALDEKAKILRGKRIQEGAVIFDKHEVSFVLDENAKPIDVAFKTMKDANKLIEEFMLLANRKVAKLINIKGVPMVQRAHGSPNADKIQSLKEFVGTLGYKLDIDTNLKGAINNLLSEIKDTPEQNMIDNLVVRTMQKAIYTTVNDGHYGLGFEHYTHFTSPIRRYSDLLVHRILQDFLNNKKNYDIGKLEEKCKHLSSAEKSAQQASRDSVKFKQAEYMSDKIGKVFKGVITSIVDFGVFIQLEDSKCDTLCHVDDLGKNGKWIHEPAKHRFVNKSSGGMFRLGDKVSVTVKAVDIEKKNINVSIF